MKNSSPYSELFNSNLFLEVWSSIVEIVISKNLQSPLSAVGIYYHNLPYSESQYNLCYTSV